MSDLPFTERAGLADEDLARWSPPVPFLAHSATPTPFPTKALPPAVRNMVKAVAASKQVPEDLPALLGLAAISTLAAPHFQVQRGGGWSEPLNLYAGVIMESGTGKTPAERDVMRPIWKIEKLIRAAYTKMLDGRIDELDINRPSTIASDPKIRVKANQIEDKIKELEDAKRRPPDLVTGSDITIETLSSQMSRQDGNAAIIDSEGEFFGILSGRYSGGKPNLGVTLKAYDGDRYRVRRIGREQDDIERATLTLGLCVQPIVLQDAVKSPAMVERGLLARFLFAWPPSLLGTRRDRGAAYDRQVMDGWSQILTDLYEHTLADHRDPRADEDELPSLHLSEAALKRHIEFCDLVERRLHPDDGDLGNLPGWASKHKGRALRIAGLLHLVSGQFVQDGAFNYRIGDEAMRAAIDICMWAIGHALRVFGENANGIEAEDGRCADIIGWLNKTRPATFRVRDIQRGCRKKWLTDGGARVVIDVLDRLTEDGYVVTGTVRDSRGRDASVYRPNPLIFQDEV